jgi:RNA polymerase sigma factor (TIGR02999 family)
MRPVSNPPTSADLSNGDTTALLQAARAGDRASYDRVFERVYDELRRVASRQAARFGSRSATTTLSTTALVHEAYLKLAGDTLVAGSDRIHFFALAARAMRQILMNHARDAGRLKRGGDVERVALDPAALAQIPEAPPGLAVENMLALDTALDRLARVDAELEQLVEWRFFAGLTLEEIAELAGRSVRTLKRDWQVARSFLVRAMDPAANDSSAAASPRE